MAIMVSFLLVQRVNLALAHYHEARENLAGMLKFTRDLVAATVSSFAMRSGSIFLSVARLWIIVDYRLFIRKMTKHNLPRNGEI